MLTTKVFNFMDLNPKHKVTIKIADEVLDFAFAKPLIDDVDTTITSFLKTYGTPPHYDPDDFEDGDDKDFDEFDDMAEDESAIINDKDNVPSSPAVSSPDEPSESVGSAPAESDQRAKDE